MFAKLKSLSDYVFAFAPAGVVYWYYQRYAGLLSNICRELGKLEGAIKQQSASNEVQGRYGKYAKSIYYIIPKSLKKQENKLKMLRKLFEQGTDGRDMSWRKSLENREYIEDVLNTGTTELFRCQMHSQEHFRDSDAQAKYVKCVDGNSDSTVSK